MVFCMNVKRRYTKIMRIKIDAKLEEFRFVMSMARSTKDFYSTNSGSWE